MYTPYEVIVKSILPAVRSLLVRELSEKYGYKQTEIAKALYITQASVSYYRSQSRGKYISEIYRFPDVLRMVRNLARKIVEEKPSKEDLMRDLNEIIMYIIAKEYMCDIHKILEPDINLEECKICESIITKKF